MGEVILANERQEGSIGFLGPCSSFCKRSFYTCLAVQRGLKDEELGGYPVYLWILLCTSEKAGGNQIPSNYRGLKSPLT